jgi:hypothetical protein
MSTTYSPIKLITNDADGLLFVEGNLNPQQFLVPTSYSTNKLIGSFKSNIINKINRSQHSAV